VAQPIYKSFFVRFKEPWYQLSQAEQNSLLQKITGALEKVGAKSQVLCSSGWSTESWQFFGVEVYPSVEAVDRKSTRLNSSHRL